MTCTTVTVHVGAYLAHDLASSMPLVCTGVYDGTPRPTRPCLLPVVQCVMSASGPL
ncbi:hypothetical protein HDG40_005664 [Paraburkholderia sp. JPY158]|uniref:Uncharacterized protein n=1 Tax=Paraburkholderia atlantica TaxID=2654982 RepID=A0A7W8QD85_PARAM|nr:hypothetical protein [Paraburkholderia atlantica]